MEPNTGIPSTMPKPEPHSSDDDFQQPGLFNDKVSEYTTAIRTHYLRNNLFFFVGCFCAMVCGSYMFCVVLIFIVLLEKIIEIYLIYNEKLWLLYIVHIASCLVNYTNIISAIYFINKD